MKTNSQLEHQSLEYYLSLKYPMSIYPEEDGGYTVIIPDLPGCMSQGETLEELTTNLKEAIEGWLCSPNINLSGNDKLLEIAI